MDQSVKLVNPEDLPKGVNVRREFENKRWEMFARNLAVGMKRTQAYTLAGYNSKDALRDSARTLAAHPEITARAEFLERERFDKRMKQETGFLAHEFCVESSLELDDVTPIYRAHPFALVNFPIPAANVPPVEAELARREDFGAVFDVGGVFLLIRYSDGRKLAEH